MPVTFALLTSKGLVRPQNEDHAVVGAWLPRGAEGQPPRLLLHAVADGLGGHAGGEVASQTAVGALVDALRREAESLLEGADCVQFLVSAFLAANNAVRAKAKGDPALEGMGTTLTAALSLDDRLFVGHVGDSRAYDFRASALTQVTKDQTMVQGLVDRGEISLEEAREHPWRHMISQSIGLAENIKVETHSLTLEDGSSFLLCTDGLHGMISDEDIGDALRSGGALEGTCKRLVRAALAAGGNDNVSVIVGSYRS